MIRKSTSFLLAAISITVVISAVTGCQHQAGSIRQTVTEAGKSGTADQPVYGGAQLWSENCIRGHNLRPPRERSDREWDIIVHHMRVRANLTAEEHRLIREFVQAAN